MDSTENLPYNIPRILGPKDRSELVEYLVDKRHSEVTIDCSPLEKIGSLDMQVFLSAAKTWQADSCTFRVININDSVISDLSFLGCNDLKLIGAEPK